MKFNCEIDNIRTLKKGMKVTLSVDDEQTRKVMECIYNFMDKPITIEFLVNDAAQIERLKQINEDQRKKIYAILKDIANSTGDSLENTKDNLKIEFLQHSQYDMFSLSNCSKELASDFIDYLLNFAFENGIPMSEHPLKYTDNVDRYLLACINHKICAVCGQPGEIHHWDAIGMGRDRNKYDDSQNKKICLCRLHHTEAHTIGNKAFQDKYYVYGIKEGKQ
ncbi:MAG: putative HNHc nuclease [Clostridiales bacterium]|nr:putative HNHc nuclease [Clostridiales bacterium]